jgi:quercetin dioxygenase-like cupin family protein
MRKLTDVLLSVATSVMLLAPVSRAGAQADSHGRAIVAMTPEQLRWFTPPYYTDGRQRAKLFGDSDGDAVWVDRVKIPGGRRVRAHTHPRDEMATVIRGTWYVGVGEHFDSTKLKAYPSGSFVMIPAGVPHFAATKQGPVIVQLNGTGKWSTDYLEK